MAIANLACGQSGNGGQKAPTTSGLKAPRTTTTLQAPVPTLAPPPQPAPDTAVISLDFTDLSRPTVSHGVTVRSGRHLPTTVYLPAADGHPIAHHLPLIVFLHGFDVLPAKYDHLLRTWAAAGYVVAAPTLPLTSADAGRELDEEDLVNEPGDASYLITNLLDAAAGPGPLNQAIDPARIAVSGHSDGASVAVAVGYSAKFADPRVDAVVSLSGEALPQLGPFDASRPGPPLLAIASDHDEYVPLSRGRRVYDAVCCDKAFVVLHGATHLPPFTQTNAWSPIVDTVTVSFLNRAAGHYAVPQGQLAADATAPPLAELQAASS